MRQHRVEFARRTGCFGECSTPVNHGWFSEACFPRRRSDGIGLEFFRAAPPRSPTVDRPSMLLGKAASAEGQDTGPKQVPVVKYIFCGRNIVQREVEFRKGQRN